MITLDVKIKDDPFEIVATSENTDVELEAKTDYVATTDDYEHLKHLPTLDGRTIIGDISEQDPTVPNWAKAETPSDGIAPEDIDAVSVKDAMTIADLAELWDSL